MASKKRNNFLCRRKEIKLSLNRSAIDVSSFQIINLFRQNIPASQVEILIAEELIFNRGFGGNYFIKRKI